MPAAPQNPMTTSTARDVAKVRTWLGEEGGGAPTEETEDVTYQPLMISRSAGAQSLNYADFRVDLGRREERLVDMVTPTGWNREIQAMVVPPDGEPFQLFWGMLASQSLRISGQGRDESAYVRARIDPYLFGDTLKGIKVSDKLSEAAILVELDPFFNPLVEGRIIANCSAHDFPYRDVNDPREEYHADAWVHPESIRTTNATTWQEEEGVSFWNLARAVRSICWMLNPDQTYILNPTVEDVAAWITDKNPPEIQNFYLRRGLYLPQCLDALLTPHGFGWFVKFGADEDGFLTRKITIFKRGEGQIKSVYLQRPSLTETVNFDPAKDNLTDLDHDLSIADLANVVEGYGALEEREVTIQLFRGWAAADDALTPDDLDKTVTTDQGSLYAAHPNAWRLWPANEAGDYNGLRPEIGSDPLDFTGVLSSFIVRRRRMGDCLQLDSTGKRMPAFAEWFNPQPEGGGDPAWEIIPPGSYSILTDQIGIMFNGVTPPSDIAAAGATDSDVAIRLTGTITGDVRLKRTATRRDESPNGLDVKLTLDVSDRFFDRQVQTSGVYASQHNAEFDYGADTRDDAADLLSYVESARDVEDAANLDVRMILSGLLFDYEIGDLINEVAGRSISFNRCSPEGDQIFLQIVGIDHDIMRQTTVLRVVENRDEGYERDGAFGGPTGKRFKKT